ncbi:Alpha/beta hydrolase family protein [Williamsia maris]|uniref:Alpha/beta hydrolase family protein n=1 Tax=Williamsia maris TaxID=72806 RepID=A0ABT1HIZ2_9NOCA|nr:Alpha/beta hydrolase family protein [Williamsia maris]
MVAKVMAVVFAVALISTGVATTATAAPAPRAEGALNAGLSGPGPYAVSATAQVTRCVGPEADAQNADARRQGAFTPLQCTSAAPIGRGPDTGVDFYYPTATGQRPLVVFVPGSRANPGYFAPLARHWASYGFVVAISYKGTELAPESGFLGLRRAVAVNGDRTSPLFGRMDLRRVVLAGHSSGATKAIEVAGIANATNGVPVPPAFDVPAAVRLVGVLALAPDVYTVPTPVRTPTLIATGTADRASNPGRIEPIVYGPITGAPAWFVVARGAPHLGVVNPLTTYPLTGVAVQFLRFVTGDPAACRSFVGPSWTLPGDGAFARVVRNATARASSCPA